MQVSVPVRNEDDSVKFEITLTPDQHKALLEWGLSMSIAMGLATQLLGPETGMLLNDDNEELDD